MMGLEKMARINKLTLFFSLKKLLRKIRRKYKVWRKFRILRIRKW